MWQSRLSADPYHGRSRHERRSVVADNSIRANTGLSRNASGSSTTWGFEWDKTIFAADNGNNVFGFAINGDYITQRGAGENLNGWDDFTVTLKDQFYCNPEHEFMMSAGVIRDLGATGSGQLLRAAVIPVTSSTAPTWYVGKGFGDLPIGPLRAFAVTGELGYAISDAPSVLPGEWDYAWSIQYSMPYLTQHVQALPIPEFFNLKTAVAWNIGLAFCAVLPRAVASTWREARRWAQ